MACAASVSARASSAGAAVRVPGSPGEEGCDYLCDDCATHPWDLDDEDLVAACMWCQRDCIRGVTVRELDEFRKDHPDV